MLIKKLNKKEIKKWEKIHLKEWLAHNRKNKYIYKENKFWFAAFIDKEIVGHIYGYTNGGVAYLDDIIVDRKYRNRGVGKELMKKFEEIAKSRKCHACLLATTDKHIEALKFYKKLGYKTEATLKNMWWKVTEYYMVKRIN